MIEILRKGGVMMEILREGGLNDRNTEGGMSYLHMACDTLT